MKHTSGWIGLALSLFCFATPSKSQTASPPPENPSRDWQTIQPEDAGYSSARLEALHAWLKTGQTSAMFVVVHGKIIFQYGDLSHASNIASIRKSILGMLYGSYVVSGKIDTYKTVKQLGLDDNEPIVGKPPTLAACHFGVHEKRGFGKVRSRPPELAENPTFHSD